MDLCALKLIRPSTLLCTSLVLVLFLFPESCLSGGKKRMPPPVKHLFGVGIGYQKVVHYKPVLVFQKHRRVKPPQPSGWGWGGSGYGSGWKGWKGYTPVVVQHHVHGKGRGHGGGGHGHGGGEHGGGGHHHHHGHREKRKRRPSHGRGWGWGWRRRRRPSHHGGGGGGGHRQHSTGGGSGWKYQEQHHENHHEPEYHPPATGAPEAAPGGEEEYGNVDGHHGHGRHRHRPREREHHRGNDGYATGYSYHGAPSEDHHDHNQDDHGGYESEIKEQWNRNNEELASPTTSVSPPPPIFPFTEPPMTDGAVTKIHKEFLRNHLKHYQELTTVKPTPFYPINSHQNQSPHPKPNLMPPSHYTDLQISEAEADNPYYDLNSSPEEMEDEPDHQHHDHEMNLLKRKVIQMAAQGSDPAPVKPSTQNQHKPIMMGVLSAPPVPTLKIKPSPKQQKSSGIANNNNNKMRMNMNNMNMNVQHAGVGNQFSDPGFFPSFDQFQRIKM